MNDLKDTNDTPDENVMVYNLNFNHDHFCESNPLVILKTTHKIKNHVENRKKWYGLVRYVSLYLYDMHLNTEMMSNWVFLYNCNNRPNGQDNCYMKEFLYDHFIHIICYMHNDPLINVHFKLFTDTEVSRFNLFKHNKDFDSWESQIYVEDIEHGDE